MYSLKSDGRLVARTAADEIAFASGSLQCRVCCAEKGSVLLLPENPYLDYIALRNSVVTIDRDGEELFRGQAVDRLENAKGFVQFTLLGDLSYLHDGLIPPFTYTGSAAGLFSAVLAVYNEQVAAHRQIQAGTISKTGLGVSMSYELTSWRSPWDIFNGLYSEFGGLLQLRTGAGGLRYLDWRDDSGHFASQPIIYGDNLLSLTVMQDATGIFNSIRATAGAGEQEITALVEDAASIAQYGRVRVHRRYDAETVEELTALAAQDLKSGVNAALRISGKAIDKWAEGKEPFRVGDFAETIDPTSRLDSWIMISELKHDLTGPSTQVTLGVMPESIERTARSGIINAWIVSRQGRAPQLVRAIDLNEIYAVDSNSVYAAARGE